MKKLLLLASIGCFACSALADEKVPTLIKTSCPNSEIQFGGMFLFESGIINQNHLIRYEKNITDNTKHWGIYTEATFNALFKQEYDNGVSGGAKIVLLPTTRPKTSTSYNGSHIFIETEYGKVELGSPYDAGANMRVTGNKVAAGTGGWDKYALLNGVSMRYKGLKPDFDTGANFYLESYSNNFDQINDKAEAARKGSYYTPKMQGVQFGISFTPDSANTGGNRDINNLTLENSATTGISKSRTGITTVKLDDNTFMTLNQNVRNAVSAGLTYDMEVNDDTSLKLSATGEYGKPARQVLHTKKHDNGTVEVLNSYKLSNLKAYNLGAVITYGGFSCAASYGSLGKSLTTPAYYKVGRSTYYYNGGVAYGQGPIKTSLTYFKSSRYKNTVDTVSLATEYKIMPGLLPYAEITQFQAKGKPVYYPEAQNNKTKGTVGLIGAKLKF